MSKHPPTTLIMSPAHADGGGAVVPGAGAVEGNIAKQLNRHSHMMNNKQITLPETGLVRLNEVLAVLGISRSTWYRGIERGNFPPPVKLGERCSRWRAEDIRGIINQS